MEFLSELHDDAGNLAIENVVWHDGLFFSFLSCDVCGFDEGEVVVNDLLVCDADFMAEFFFDEFAHCCFGCHGSVDVGIYGGDYGVVCYAAFNPVESFPWLLAFAAECDEVEPLDVVLWELLELIFCLCEEDIDVEAIGVEDCLLVGFSACDSIGPVDGLLSVVGEIEARTEVEFRSADVC